MASPIALLTPEQAQRSREVILNSIAKLPPSYSKVQAIPLHLAAVPSNDSLGKPLSSAGAEVRMGAQYPPPPGLSTWQNPEYHDQVISTFFSIAQTTVGYVPNAVGSTASDQVQGFNKFLAELLRYSPYLILKDSKTNKYTHSSTDCGPLLQAATNFMEAVGNSMGSLNAAKLAQDVVSLIEQAVKALGSSSSEKVESTQYSFFVIEGNTAGNKYPVAFVFYSFVNMERHTSGKSTVSSQTIEMYSYGYEIQSPIVVENAAALANGVVLVGSKDFAANINNRLP